MSVIKILLTYPDADEFEPFAHDDAQYEFSKITSRTPSQIFEGPIWIFIDWVLDDLAGLEFCRRLRADPQTAGAHITMVLNDEDFVARKRALDAGADDYMTGPIDRRVNNNMKVGVGDSLSGFLDDLTDQSYSSHGPFLNLLSKFSSTNSVQ